MLDALELGGGLRPRLKGARRRVHIDVDAAAIETRRGRQRKYSAKWRDANAQRQKDNIAAWKVKNREKWLAIKRAWARRNRKRQNLLARIRYAKQRAAVEA